MLQFLPDKAEVVDKTDFNGRPVKKVRFHVIDVNDERRMDKYFELSRMHVPKMYEELKTGKTILEISRLGTGKETRYFVKAVG